MLYFSRSTQKIIENISGVCKFLSSWLVKLGGMGFRMFWLELLQHKFPAAPSACSLHGMHHDM